MVDFEKIVILILLVLVVIFLAIIGVAYFFYDLNLITVALLGLFGSLSIILIMFCVVLSMRGEEFGVESHWGGLGGGLGGWRVSRPTMLLIASLSFGAAATIIYQHGVSPASIEKQAGTEAAASKPKATPEPRDKAAEEKKGN